MYTIKLTKSIELLPELYEVIKSVCQQNFTYHEDSPDLVIIYSIYNPEEAEFFKQFPDVLEIINGE